MPWPPALAAGSGTEADYRRRGLGGVVRGRQGGEVRNKSGDRYKPSSLRDYERNMRLRVLPELGAAG